MTDQWPPKGPGIAIVHDADYDGWPRGMPEYYGPFDFYEDFKEWEEPFMQRYHKHIQWQRLLPGRVIVL